MMVPNIFDGVTRQELRDKKKKENEKQQPKPDVNLDEVKIIIVYHCDNRRNKYRNHI